MPDFPVLQHSLDDVAGLVGLVAHGDELRKLRRLALGPEILGETFRGEFDHAIGGGKDRLRRAIVPVERDDVGGGGECVREIEDVADGRGAEGIDRLRVVADDGEAAPAGFQRQQDRGLKAVGVLIFVDQDVVEPAADILRQRRLANGLRPIEQQIVVIEDVLRLLGLDIGREQVAELRPPSGAPGKRDPQHLLERQFRIDGAGIDGEAGPLGREPALGLREAKLMSSEVHEIGGILPVMDREIGIEADLLRVVAQDPRADPMERAGPRERVRHDAGVGAHRQGANAFDAARHLGSRPAGESHQQDAARIGAVDDQMGDAMGERVGLAGSRPAMTSSGPAGAQSFSRTPCSTARRCSGLSFSR